MTSPITQAEQPESNSELVGKIARTPEQHERETAALDHYRVTAIAEMAEFRARVLREADQKRVSLMGDQSIDVETNPAGHHGWFGVQVINAFVLYKRSPEKLREALESLVLGTEEELYEIECAAHDRLARHEWAVAL